MGDEAGREASGLPFWYFSVEGKELKRPSQSFDVQKLMESWFAANSCCAFISCRVPHDVSDEAAVIPVVTMNTKFRSLESRPCIC